MTVFGARMHTRCLVIAAALGTLGLTQVPTSPLVSSGFIYESAPYPECHASTIAETTAGTLVTADDSPD